jgi:hypothetical protein
VVKAATEDQFVSLTNLDSWQPLDEYFEGCDEKLLSDIKKNLEWRSALRKKLLEDPAFKDRVKTLNPADQEWAKEQLFAGRVCAVDGTLSIIPSTSGGRARIGVVATSYKSDRIERVVYVSYGRLAEPVSDPTDYFKKLKSVNSTSNLLMRAVMAYAERELALRREEPWKFIHGELLPYELRTGAGHTRIVLPRALELGMKLIDCEKAIGVIEGSEDIDLLNAVETLEKNEYVEARTLAHDLQKFLEGEPDPDNPGERIGGAHFGDEDRRKVEKFKSDYGTKVKVGIFKVGFKPFLFQAHASNFERAAALVMVDAMMQPMRGFPLLIDYADQICSKQLAGGEFERQIQFKTARFGIEALGYEIDPRKTRRR